MEGLAVMSANEKPRTSQRQSDALAAAAIKPDAGQQISLKIDAALPKATESKMAKMLDHANNRLQELVQILYLLSRDPAVPQDARCHVTVAQGEIERLVSAMRDSAEPKAESPNPPLKAFSTAHS
jgi:hypothetical protein